MSCFVACAVIIYLFVKNCRLPRRKHATEGCISLNRPYFTYTDLCAEDVNMAEKFASYTVLYLSDLFCLYTYFFR